MAELQCDPDLDLTPAPLEAAGALGGTPDPGYQWPTSPEVQANLEKWRDLKLGVIMHWGIYSYIHQGGSWSLHREDLGWFTDKPEGFNGTDSEYHTWYFDQARHFTGHEFDAADWAQVCADAGMRYLLFTTKHHDGFCMYDSKYTNVKCTAEDAGLQRDILLEVTTAFRARNFEIGAYFSKADWSRAEYWNRGCQIHNRFHNYSIEENPKLWERFVGFTHDQIEEILTEYGPFNSLWLDAGWVREPEEPIRMDAIASRAREINPGILIVDREVHGPYEDYRTPEQTLPDMVLDFPWESCITMTREWCAMSRDDPSKPTRELVGNLIRIVARGGNYLIGIGPDSTGHMPDSVRRGLSELGQWMRICGEGIYESRVPSNPPKIDGEEGFDWFLTADARTDSGSVLPPGAIIQRNKTVRLYAFGIPGTDTVNPTELRVHGHVHTARVLGGPDITVKYHNGISVLDIPRSPTLFAVGVELTVSES